MSEEKRVWEKVRDGDYDNRVAWIRDSSPEQRRAYRDGEAEQRSKLQADLEAEHGLSNHPKKDVLWRLAWDEGHSAGYSEVALVYDRMAELLTP